MVDISAFVWTHIYLVTDKIDFENSELPCISSKVDILYYFLEMEQALPTLWRGGY